MSVSVFARKGWLDVGKGQAFFIDGQSGEVCDDIDV